jgi:hypothetical protein
LFVDPLTQLSVVLFVELDKRLICFELSHDVGTEDREPSRDLLLYFDADKQQNYCDGQYNIGVLMNLKVETDSTYL